MKKYKVTRDRIIEVMVTHLQPLSNVYALWEAGAASFKRVDQWSDLDLYVVVEDDSIEDVLKVIEQTILLISEFDLKFRLPEPTWHGHSQVFYRLKDTSPFLFLDIAVMKKSSEDKFLQYQIHSKPIVHFDKIGIVKNDRVQPAPFLEKLEKRLQILRTTFELFQVLTLKELNRGNDIVAFGYYLNYTYRPLVEVLRIKYSPYHYNFHNSYIYYDLPADVVKRLHKLNFIADPRMLSKCRAEAEVWFLEEINSISRKDLEKKIFHPDL
ncbi:MAG: nucleotidyltransferase domain-containing protein [candidate division Zixibacteria bacterium]|nr:nucleotidyltransferase domain-containing protein [candidate division Zixibacteria bacterium]